MVMSLLSLFFPPHCPYCGVLIDSGHECASCRRQFPDGIYGRRLSDQTICVAPFRYDGPVQKNILLMKKDGQHIRFDSLAEQMARVVQQFGIVPDVVTDVPMYWLSKGQRGYNQSEELARRTAKRCGCPYEPLLKKCRKSKVQHTLNAEQRHTNVQGIYAVRSPQKIQGRHILLVDDVCTTGSTMEVCTALLRQNGAESITCVAAAIAGENDTYYLMSPEQAAQHLFPR